MFNEKLLKVLTNKSIILFIISILYISIYIYREIYNQNHHLNVIFLIIALFNIIYFGLSLFLIRKAKKSTDKSVYLALVVVPQIIGSLLFVFLGLFAIVYVQI
ncbi:MAG: hypothetical protein RLZZ175_1260 [Bacteroidota bacterium]